MSRHKKWVDPRKEIRRLAKELASCDPRGIEATHNIVVDARRLGQMILKLLKNEPVTIVMNQDESGMTATAHPSPHYARLEMISNMLDIGDGYFMDRGEGHEFLKLVSEGKFKAAIDFWNEESIAQGSDGSYFDTHDGKVERNYTVAELKKVAQDALDDAQKLGRYKP